MSEHDIGDVFAPKPETLDLSCGRLLFAELEPRNLDKRRADSPLRVCHVEQPDPRVDQNEPAITFEQQAVTRGPGVRRGVKRAAVEIVDLECHCRSIR
jgi:hypothetical protein